MRIVCFGVSVSSEIKYYKFRGITRVYKSYIEYKKNLYYSRLMGSVWAGNKSKTQFVWGIKLVFYCPNYQVKKYKNKNEQRERFK